MQQGDEAPYDGYLLNEYTWQHMTHKLNKCNQLQMKNIQGE